MSQNDNGKRGAMPPSPPPSQINPEDIESQVGVLRTKQGGTAVIFPKNLDGTPDLPLALELMGMGLNILAQIMRQMAPQDARRIVVVPSVPPGIDLRGKAGK